jgi:hypothetical protein
MIKFIVILSCVGFLYACVEFSKEQQNLSKPLLSEGTQEKEPVKPTDFNLHKVLDQKCSRCHGKEKTKGSFDLVKLLDKGVLQEDSARWNEVYRVLQDGDMPPEDEEQLTDAELLGVVGGLEQKLQSSKEVSRLLTADEIINSVSDIFGVDPENDNQMENLYSYQDNDFQSTIDNKQIMSVFFMNDYSQMLDGVIDEYVHLKQSSEAQSTKKTKKSKKAVPSIFDPKSMTINSVGFASRSHYWPEKDFIDLRGRYSPHANALKEEGAKNLNLIPGRYKLSFEAATFNRQAITEVIEKYSNRRRLKDEKAKINVYVMPVYAKTRPSSTGKEKFIQSFFIEDEQFKTYSVEIDVNRSTPIGLSFENGPHSGGRLKSALPGYPKDGVPPDKHKFPFVRFKNITLNLVTPANNFLSIAESELNETEVSKKIQSVITQLGLSLAASDIADLYATQIANGIAPFKAYKKALKAIFMSPEFLYLENFGSSQSKLRFASYSLLKSAPDKAFSNAYEKLKNGQISQEDFIAALVKFKNFKRFSDRFTYEWLQLHEMVSNQPDEELYKEFYMENYNYAFTEQTNRYVKHLFAKNRPISELVQSDYTFVNDNLQRFYGLGFSSQANFRKIKLSDLSIGGLMTQGSFLAATSNGVEALPFRRAKWISENILNKQIPPPPDNISVQEFEEAKGSFSDKMKVHSTNSQCASCHKLLDPIAAKLRYYDSIGRLEHHFKPEVALPEVKSLKEKYMRSSYKTALSFTRKVLSFSTGRKTDISDYKTIEKIVDKCSATDYKAADLLAEIVQEYF